MSSFPTFTVDDAVNFLCKLGTSFFTTSVGEALVSNFDGLRLPASSSEAKQCKEVKKLLDDYVLRDNPPRPLSIAVFGPPGSGKSSTVKRLANLVTTGKIERARRDKFVAIQHTRRAGKGDAQHFFIGEKGRNSPGVL